MFTRNKRNFRHFVTVRTFFFKYPLEPEPPERGRVRNPELTGTYVYFLLATWSRDLGNCVYSRTITMRMLWSMTTRLSWARRRRSSTVSHQVGTPSIYHIFFANFRVSVWAETSLDLSKNLLDIWILDSFIFKKHTVSVPVCWASDTSRQCDKILDTLNGNIVLIENATTPRDRLSF